MAKVLITTAGAFYDRDGSISVREARIDGPSHGELLVRIAACGICASETMTWYIARKAPLVLGHEPVGIVEACGDGVEGFRPGDRVYVHHHAPCMACRRCRRGDFVQCDTWRATRLTPGGMSQLALVPESIVRADVLPLPDSISDDAAVFVEPLATVVKSLRRARLRPGDRVLVLGLGVMGLLHVMLARRQRAELLIGADSVASRRAKALELGAGYAYDQTTAPLAVSVKEATGGEGADIVIVGPGSLAAIESAAACVAPGGTIVLFTPLPPHQRWPMPVHDVYFKDVSVVSSYSAGPNDMREALELLASGFPAEQLVSHRFGLRDARTAYRLVADAGEALKVIVYPNKP
jgi:L-iditol 2-dehydrogenase